MQYDTKETSKQLQGKQPTNQLTHKQKNEPKEQKNTQKSLA